MGRAEGRMVGETVGFWDWVVSAAREEGKEVGIIGEIVGLLDWVDFSVETEVGTAVETKEGISLGCVGADTFLLGTDD